MTESNPRADAHPLTAGWRLLALSASWPWVLAVAVLVAVLTMAPYWRAQAQAPSGWSFTGNLSGSPDMMQYRVWMRQTQQTGILVDNRFTTEPNRPYLPVILYYVIGQTARWTGWSPEWVYAYMGALLALAFVPLLFATVRLFVPNTYRAWWIFGVILLGGGLGAHFKALSQLGIVNNNPILHRLVFDVLLSWPVFEDYRGNYVILTLFDTHYLLFWFVTLAAVLSLYAALRNPSPGRLALMATLFVAATFLHVYEGVTLLMITAGVALVCWRKQGVVRAALIVLAAGLLAVGISYLGLAVLYQSSGLPAPDWHAVNILVATLLIAFPIGWALVLWGIQSYWRQASFDQCFLLGWLLGCTALTLSGPFFPYPDRGIITLQIPLYIVAGSIYFAQRPRIGKYAMAAILLLLGATPFWLLARILIITSFHTTEPAIFISASHQAIVETLRQRATQDDVLIVDKSDVAWHTDDLWLVPDFPGKLYCGHFFLTVDFDRKCAEVNRFFQSAPAQQAAFLQQAGIRFVYVDAAQDPRRFSGIQGLMLLKAEQIGSLFEYTARSDASR